jgi:hypothetical protein
MTATAVARRTHCAPIGTGALHQALEDARDLDRLHRFCQSQQLDVDAVSTADGKRIDILRTFAAMRARGYVIADPKRSQSQLKRGLTTWLVDIQLPAGPSLSIGFYTPNTS